MTEPVGFHGRAKFQKVPLEHLRCRAIEIEDPSFTHPIRRRCHGERLDGNDLCQTHTMVEAAGARVRRVTEPVRGKR